MLQSNHTRTGTKATRRPSQGCPIVSGSLEDRPNDEVRSGNILTPESNQTDGLGSLESLEQREIHMVWLKQVPHVAPASQEQPSFGQSSIPNRNLVVTSTRSGPTGIVAPTILLSDYEQLQNNFEELKQHNDELTMKNEETMRKLQGITALLRELIG